VNNYDDVFPTEKIVSVKATEYDFTAPAGKALGTQFMDDNFTNLKRDANGNAVVEVVDPAARYGLRITALSPEIKAVQVYAPVDRDFIAVEPQFNLNDPYNKAWGCERAPKGRSTLHLEVESPAEHLVSQRNVIKRTSALLTISIRLTPSVPGS